MILHSRGFIIALHEFPPERLVEVVESLRPAHPVSLTELVARVKAGKSNRGLFAITVDDGVGENFRNLAPLFAARQWPATFYLPTRYLDSGEPLAFQWWWKLRPLLPLERLELRYGPLDLRRPEAIDELSRTIERMWHTKRAEAYEGLMMDLADAVAGKLGIAKGELRCPAPVSWHEVDRWSANPLLQFESHGVSHGAMSDMGDAEIELEMRLSREIVEEHTGRPCRHFCYPFGSAQAIGRAAPRIARRYYDSAVTLERGCLDGSDLWLAPRIGLYPKNSLPFAHMKLFIASRWIGRRRSHANEPARIVESGESVASRHY